MNREIKFKALDVDSGLIETVMGIYYHHDYIEVETKEHKSIYTRELGEDIILLQFTGLKDKNSVEIYEGDVVEFVYPERKCEVIFKEDLARFQLRYLTEKQQNGDLIKIYCNEITIIGNKFDNPELLGV